MVRLFATLEDRVFSISIFSQFLYKSSKPQMFPPSFLTSAPLTISHATSPYAHFLMIPPPRLIIVFATSGLKTWQGNLIYPHLYILSSVDIPNIRSDISPFSLNVFPPEYILELVTSNKSFVFIARSISYKLIIRITKSLLSEYENYRFVPIYTPTKRKKKRGWKVNGVSF